jgi:hypothetical protein
MLVSLDIEDDVWIALQEATAQAWETEFMGIAW